MLNSVACKSSSEGTFWTKQLIATIVACGMLRVNTSLRSKVIALRIRRNRQENPYRRSRGGQNLFHRICTLLTNSRHQQHIGNLNSPSTINRANLRIIHLVNAIPWKTKNLQCATIDCRSIVNKSADLKVEISNNKHRSLRIDQDLD